MGQAQINVRIRACSRTIAMTKQAALTHNVRGKELNSVFLLFQQMSHNIPECVLISVINAI